MTITTARLADKTRGNWACAVVLPAFLLATQPPGAGAAHLTGPTYTIDPGAPPGYSFAFTGDSGRAGGGDLTLSDFDLSIFAELYSGPAAISGPHAVSASMDGAIDSAGEDLVFDLAGSTLASGIARWTGSTTVTHNPTGNAFITVDVLLRFTLTITDAGGAVTLLDASTVMGISVVGGVGAVVSVPGDFTANRLVEASLDGGATWTPMIDLFDSLNTVDPTLARISLDNGFWFSIARPGPLEPCRNHWAPDPGGAKRNRTGCIKMPTSAVAGGQEVAIRVTLNRLYIDSNEDPANGCPVRQGLPDLQAFEGEVRYLGPPSAFFDNALTDPRFIAAELQCTPFYRDWSPAALTADFGPDVDTGRIYYYGTEVFPCSIHDAQQATQSCVDSGSESCFSDPLEIRTALWGDVWPPFGVVNFTDIGKVVDAFKGIPFDEGPPPSGAPRKVRAMLRDNSVPLDSSVNFTDIGNVVNAFKTIAYAEDGPTACP